jgi:hypothetical protein
MFVSVCLSCLLSPSFRCNSLSYSLFVLCLSAYYTMGIVCVPITPWALSVCLLHHGHCLCAYFAVCLLYRVPCIAFLSSIPSCLSLQLHCMAIVISDSDQFHTPSNRKWRKVMSDQIVPGDIISIGLLIGRLPFIFPNFCHVSQFSTTKETSIYFSQFEYTHCSNSTAKMCF